MLEEDLKVIEKELKRDNITFDGKNILITGGAGFLGSWICDYLIRDGAKVTCLDNFASGVPSNIEHLKENENFNFVKHDISKPIYFNEKYDQIIHMASRASPFEFKKYPIQILKSNTLGVWISLGIAKEHKARLLYTSTSEVYGNPDPRFVPTPETYNGNVNPIGPRGCYDEAKRAGEAFVMAYRLQHGLDTRIVRIFNTYGPRMRSEDIYGRAVPRFIEQALKNEPITVFGDGSQTRSFTYVTDEVEGILRLAAMDGVEGKVVNIGNDNETTILTNSDSEIIFLPLPEDDPERRSPDITRAKKILRWKPKVSLKDGLAKTIKWFEVNPPYLKGRGLSRERQG